MHPSPDLLALLALGEEAGTPEERAHVASCPECRAEISDLARAVAAGRSGGAESGLVRPPDRVWHAIRAELGLGSASGSGPSAGSPAAPDGPTTTVVPTPRVELNGSTPDQPSPDQGDPVAARSAPPPERNGTVTSIADARPRSSRARRSLAALVAAAVALVLGIGLGFGLDRFLTPRPTVLWTAELQAQADFPGSRGQAIVEQEPDGERRLVVELDSPEPVEGSRAVWLIQSAERMRFLGYLDGDEDSWPVPSDLDPREYPIVDVSKEPPGDPDPRHSQVSIVRGTLNV